MEQVWINIILLNHLRWWQPDTKESVHAAHLHMHILSPPLALPLFSSYKEIFDMIITWSAFSHTINHLCHSLNRWTYLQTPEHYLPPWASTVCGYTPSNLVILPQLIIKYIMSVWEDLPTVYFNGILNHCPLVLTRSLNCQGADIFLPDIWIFLPSPLNFSTRECKVRDGEAGGCRLMCSYSIQSKISRCFEVLP